MRFDMAEAKICAVVDCGKQIIAHGYCTKHYQRWKKHGDPLQTHRNEGVLCSVDQCWAPAKARGLCRSHYWRMQQHGDPLAGRTPEGEPERFLNEVVLAYDGDECLAWPYSNNGAGYGLLWRNGQQQLVSRIICEARHGAPPTQEHEAAHSCGHGHLLCVTPSHIQWETPSENQMDRVKHDTHQRGERHPMGSLTEVQVRQIRALEGQMLQRKVAEIFGIGRVQVGRIWRRDRWGWLD